MDGQGCRYGGGANANCVVISAAIEGGNFRDGNGKTRRNFWILWVWMNRAYQNHQGRLWLLSLQTYFTMRPKEARAGQL